MEIIKIENAIFRKFSQSPPLKNLQILKYNFLILSHVELWPVKIIETKHSNFPIFHNPHPVRIIKIKNSSFHNSNDPLYVKMIKN